MLGQSTGCPFRLSLDVGYEGQLEKLLMFVTHFKWFVTLQ